MPQTLINRATEAGVSVMFGKLEHRIHAYYIIDGGRPFIFLAESLKENTVVLRCVLAEELGHYYTSAGIGVPIPHVLYRDRTKLTQDEYRALRWAAKQLLPIDRLIQAFQSGIRQLWELAEYFRVTEDMIRFRLKMIEVGAIA